MAVPKSHLASGHRRGRLLLALLGLVGTTILMACGPTRPTVLAYGDSLTVEAQHWFVASFPPSVRVRVHAAGGNAICDYLPAMAAEIGRTHPVAVVFEFAGNGLTPCTRPAPGQASAPGELVSRYQSDADAATALAATAHASAWWIGAPANRDPSANIGNAAIRGVYAGLPAHYANAHYVDAGLSVEADGHYTDILPCLTEEPCERYGGAAVNRVRASDGGHLCPVHQAFVDTCPIWSSGAYRFGQAMAEPVIAFLHLRPVRPRTP